MVYKVTTGLRKVVLSHLLNVTMRGDIKSLKCSCFSARFYVNRMRKFYPFSFHMFISNQSGTFLFAVTIHTIIIHNSLAVAIGKLETRVFFVYLVILPTFRRTCWVFLEWQNFYDIVQYKIRNVCQFDGLSTATLENSNFIKIQALGSTQSLFNGKLGSFPRVKWAGREVDYFPSSAEVKNEWSPSLLPHVSYRDHSVIFTGYAAVYFGSRWKDNIEMYLCRRS